MENICQRQGTVRHDEQRSALHIVNYCNDAALQEHTPLWNMLLLSYYLSTLR